MTPRLALLAAALSAVTVPAAAHRPWLLPSTTTVSGADDWVSVDAAISNDLFYPDHFPMPVEGIRVWAPDGGEGQIQNAMKGRYRSTFDVELNRPGTWKIGTASDTVTGRFKVNGEEWSVGRRRGPPPGAGQPGEGQPRPAGGAMRAEAREGGGPGEGGARPGGPPAHSVPTVADIPANATDVQLTEIASRNEIFVTAGAPSRTVLAPTGKGLELDPITHPDALVSNEPAKLRFLIDGRPAAGIRVTLVPGGKRYRDAEGAQELVAGPDGVLTIRWPSPGMFWLNATATDAHPSLPRASERRMSYVTTLEVQAP